MDALALLCNLYGDGPATLKRLRVHGVLRIEDLSEKPAGELANVLALTPATTRRFLKEAKALRKRVFDGGEGLERDAAPRVAPRAPREVLRGQQAIIDAVSRRWVELDRDLSPATEMEAPREVAKPVVIKTPLAAAEFDRATHFALESAGISTLEELIAADGESLAQAADLGLSQVLFAQGLARRKARESNPAAESAPAQVADENLAVHVLQPPSRANARFSPRERAPAEFLSEGSDEVAGARSTDEGAGPFA